MAKKCNRILWKQKLSKDTPTLLNNCTKPPLIGLKKTYKGVVLGIDPSLRGTGLALVEFERPSKWVLKKVKQVALASRISMPECLKSIFEEVTLFLEGTEVRHVALEKTIYVQNIAIAQILGAARGAAITAVARQKIPVFEYEPLRIKQAVVGYGRASKIQMTKTIEQLFEIESGSLNADQADAAGAALCHGFTWNGNT